MSAVNIVLITGEIGDNPKTKYLNDKDYMMNFILRNSYMKKTVDGKGIKNIQNFLCVAYSTVIRNLNHYVKPGNKVMITGYLKQFKYTETTGDIRYGVTIVAEKINLFGKSERKKNEFE